LHALWHYSLIITLAFTSFLILPALPRAQNVVHGDGRHLCRHSRHSGSAHPLPLNPPVKEVGRHWVKETTHGEKPNSTSKSILPNSPLGAKSHFCIDKQLFFKNAIG
jgi:hypothetical protein